LELTGGQDGTG